MIIGEIGLTLVKYPFLFKASITMFQKAAWANCKPEGMVNLTRMKILAEITITTFDEQDQKFSRGLENLSKEKKNRIHSVIR